MLYYFIDSCYECVGIKREKYKTFFHEKFNQQ